MELVYLSRRRQRRLWPIVGLVAVVGMTVTLQAMVAVVGAAQRTPPDRTRAQPVAGHAMARAPATTAATVFAAGLENGD